MAGKTAGNDPYDGGPVAALRRIAFLMERGREETRRIQAFRDDSEHVVRLSVSKPLVEQAPEVKDGEFDREAIAIHYGLVDAPSDIDPDDPESTEEADELRAGREPAAERRARMLRHEESSGPRGRQILPSDSHEGP